MSVEHSYSAPPEFDEDQLKYWYELYRRYSNELRDDGAPSVPIYRFAEFVSWWRQLADHVRQECMLDYQTGYKRLLNEAARRARAIISGNTFGAQPESS